MKIIISPAKKINDLNDFNYKGSIPKYLNRAAFLYEELKKLSKEEVKAIYKCSDKLVDKTINDLNKYDLNQGFIHALFTYDGPQYRSMAPSILEDEDIEYLNSHLYIISGLYGLLKPLDLIVPYRLEMGFKGFINLYDYWKDLYLDFKDEDYIINLASNEYSETLIPYLKDKSIDVIFLDNNKIKSTYAKMARGAMVRYLAINKIEDPQEMINFKELNYEFDKEASNAKTYIFKRN